LPTGAKSLPLPLCFPAAAKATAAGAASGLHRSAEIAGESLRSVGASVIDGVRDTVSGAAASAGETVEQPRYLPMPGAPGLFLLPDLRRSAAAFL